MALRYRNLRRISTNLPGFISSLQCQECTQTTKLLPSSWIPLARALRKIDATGVWKDISAARFSTVAEMSRDVSQEVDLISFIRMAFDHTEGPCHSWLNRSNGSKEFLDKDGAFLLLAEAFLEDPSGYPGDRTAMLKKVKFLQQRYPWLPIFGFQSGSSICSTADHNDLIRVIMEEYINFPILLSSKTFPEMENGACCFLFKGLKESPLCHDRDTDLSNILEAIKELSELHEKKPGNADKLKSTWSKQTEGFKEPHVSSSLRNLLLYLPACISADESGNRLFLSDSNHHRVIVFDTRGKILDAIGSSPGFEDGDFDTAKLMRPAASYYHSSEDCLYLVDSENHAIRRADMAKRVLETLYPTCSGKGRSGLWAWVLDKLGLKGDKGLKSVEHDSKSLLFPWHILQSQENNLLIMNKSFDTLWIMDLDSGVIYDVVRGQRNIVEFCGPPIMEKVSCLKDVSGDFLQQLVYSSHPLNGISYSGLVSSFVTFGDDLIICDTVGQRVLMLNKQTEVASIIDFSNMGILGLPYWLSCSLERVFTTGNAYEEVQIDHIQSFTLFPGRTDIHLSIDIPSNTELVEPLQESCIWCQARGAAMEVLGVESIGSTTEKVGLSQQWYDELDNLALETEPESDIATEEKPILKRNLGDGKIHIDCVVNTSPGTSEVTISAPLYLKLQSSSKSCENTQEAKAAQIAKILRHDRVGSTGREAFIRLLLKLERDLGDLVFMKPLHVKIKFITLYHPKAENSRDIILTDCAVDVNVSLN